MLEHVSKKSCSSVGTKLRRKIVFVLGAGASKEFGPSMPIGSELADRIELSLNKEFGGNESGFPAGPISSAIMRTGLQGKHRIAANNIRRSIHVQESIDDLLNAWRDIPEMIEVGKIAIANTILEAEQLSALGGRPCSDDHLLTVVAKLKETWLGQIFRFYKLDVSRRDMAELLRDLAFISFNYDRCLEEFLFAEIRALAGKPAEDSLEIFSKIPIVHPYGFLGQSFGSGTPPLIPFGMSGDLLWHVAKNIKTYTEEDHDQANLKRVEGILGDAIRVVFLGFGYHPKNIELLCGLGLGDVPEIMGACLHPDQARLNSARRIMGGNKNRMNLVDSSCSDFISLNRNAVLN